MNTSFAPEFHTDHNVYILGAGYSAEARLPVMSNFLSVMQKVRVAGSLAKDEKEAIDQLLQFRLELAGASNRINLDLDNIETLFSLTASQIMEGGHILDKTDRLRSKIQLAIGATLNYCQNEYYELPISSREDRTFGPDGVALDFFDFSAGIMSGTLGALKGNQNQENTIISFNYDTLLEDSFSKNQIYFSYGYGMPRSKSQDLLLVPDVPGQRNCVTLLKLHGSLNWSETPIKGADGLAVNIYKDYKELRTKSPDRIPTLMPPWWKKDPTGFTTSSWANAAKKLQTATRIIIIGYSLPVTDQYVKYLLGAGLSKNISLSSVWVVNNNAHAMKSVKSTFSPSFANIIFPRPMRAREFFYGSETSGNYLEAINRKPEPN
ncbi:hypothetical protein HMI48_01440 [Acidithiobacillus ferrooxidans]|uniref:SIR2 family protein n=1 Tax=Acidithiobacillus ferrooxidans TaxID=920 RepID=UPI001C07966E|nr:SIR2 family protein [Acidithiobacillus ferrooxidans]MBU2772623.1 hypothetical protein [Acidithiobacillus ferrooxidans]